MEKPKTCEHCKYFISDPQVIDESLRKILETSLKEQGLVHDTPLRYGKCNAPNSEGDKQRLSNRSCDVRAKSTGELAFSPITTSKTA